MSNETPELSLVIPVFNEQESVADLMAAIRSALASMTVSYEVLFVDDGSADGTLDALKSFAAADPRVRVLSFRRNLGKSPALTCGFQHAVGRYIVTMDADLQDDPRDIPKMHEYIRRERVGIVIGWRRARQDSLLKVISSKLFNQGGVRLLFGVSFHYMNCGLKCYEADAARDLRLYGGMHRFIPVIASEMGYRVAELPVQHHGRRHGASKYPSTKIFTELPDLLTLFFLMK
jgi:glycosyltransferase involved in cell wall biosynthesis